MKVVILAGGGGTRLWPLSRKDFPKQFLRFNEPLSLLQKTVRKFLHASFRSDVIVSTNQQYTALVKEQLQSIDPEGKCEILVEPERKNTAPAIALVVKYLESNGALTLEEPILVIPSDHSIKPESAFLDCLGKMAGIARQGNIVTFGIRPAKPETGYGYIQIGEPCGDGCLKVRQFVEKPKMEKAIQYVSSGDFYWNSGMFLFNRSVFWEELRLHAPEIYRLCEGDWEAMAQRYSSMPDLSIDYAVMEKSKRMLVCPLSLEWSDIGSWDNVYEVMEKDHNLNVKIGNVLEMDTKNSLILGGKRLISTIGLEDVLIVETEDATFISKKGESQRVKNLVQQLASNGKKESEKHVAQRFEWGTCHSLVNETHCCLERLTLLPRKRGIWEKPNGQKTILIALLPGAVLIDKEGEKALSCFEPVSVASQFEILNQSEDAVDLFLIGSLEKGIA